MIAKIVEKRRDGRSSFIQLISYVTLRDDDNKLNSSLSEDNLYQRKSRSKEAIFNQLVDYIDRNSSLESQHIIATFPDGRQQVRCDSVVCETNCFSLESSSAEMNAVAMQNTRCVDPVYHFILSWHEEENPTDEQIFDSARYCIASLGMGEHQFVTAIHRDTDNVHCHIAVNRINPVSYRAANLYKDVDKLHRACRYLELKHNFIPDNGCWKRNENGDVVRNEREFKNIPNGAKKLEYYADTESLFSYAVGECRKNIGTIFHDKNLSWEMIHAELIRAGLELKKKDEGLAIYSRHHENLTPIKASSLHPDLTLACLERVIGEFQASPKIVMQLDNNGKLISSNYYQQYVYDIRLHARDNMVRFERRSARAEARLKLQADYQSYKNSWVRPTITKEQLKQRYQAIAKEFSWQRNHVRLTIRDPLLRKLTYNVIAVEQMKAEAKLRLDLKEERIKIYADPANKRLTYREWVEVQAIKQNQAAISQLRGWAYHAKRKDKTASVSKNAIVCSAVDDIRPYNIKGYQTSINRDGTILYKQHDTVKLQDTGERIEVVEPYVLNGQHIASAMSLAEEKSGDKLKFVGDGKFVEKACSLVNWFNSGSKKQIQLTDAEQRTMAGYNKTVVTDKRQVNNVSLEPVQKPTEKPKNRFTP